MVIFCFIGFWIFDFEGFDCFSGGSEGGSSDCSFCIGSCLFLLVFSCSITDFDGEMSLID